MYDYESRVTHIYRMDGLSEIDVAFYAYDALGRRIWKYDPAAVMTDVYYYYNDQWQILCEYTAETTCRQWFSYGNYIDEVLSRNTHPTDMQMAQYYAHDHLYSPAALVSWDGAAAQERYEYDAYGKAAITARGADNVWYTADDVTLTASAYHNPFTFTGRQLDILDSGALHHMHYRHRSYSPLLGSFLQQDLLGTRIIYKNLRQIATSKQYQDGLSLYQYVSSKPVTSLDPKGQSIWYCTTDSDFGVGKHAYIYDDSFGDTTYPGHGNSDGGQSCGMNGSSGGPIADNNCNGFPDGCRKGPSKGEDSPWNPDKEKTGGKNTNCQRIGGTDDPDTSLCVMAACHNDINSWPIWFPWVHDCHNGVQDSLSECGVEMVDDDGIPIPTDRL